MTPPRKGSLLVIFLTVFIDLLGFGMVLPLLPVYGRQFARQFDWSADQIGWVVGLLMASFSAMQFIFLPLWGRLSDKFGRRPIILCGLAGSAICYLGFGLATAWVSLAGLFAARIGAGIAGATISTAQAYLADSTPKETRAKAMALIGAAFALGFTLGPMLGAAALLFGGDAATSPWPGFLAAGLSGAAFLLAVFLLPESLHRESHSAAHRLFDWQGLRAAMAVPSIGLLLLSSFIAVFSFANFESSLSLQIESIVREQTGAARDVGEGGEGNEIAAGALTGGAVVDDEPNASARPVAPRAAAAASVDSPVLKMLFGWGRQWGLAEREPLKNVIIFFVFTYLGITLTLAQGVVVRRVAGRVSESAMAIGGSLGALAGFLMLAYAATINHFELLLVAMAFEVVGFAFVNPSLQSLISRRTDPQYQGSILGLSQSAASLARIAGPVVAIPLFMQAPAWPYAAASACIAVGLVLIIAASRGGRDFP